MISSAIRRPTFWLLTCLVVVAAVLRFRALGFGLPHTQARPDETVVIEAARTLLSGHFPRFYDYPWLYPSVLGAAYVGYFLWGATIGAFHSIADMVASWPVRWAPFFLISRTISATLGTASIVIVYQVARRVAGVRTGIVSALFLTFAFMHAAASHFGTTDVMMVFLILMAVRLTVDADQTGDARTWTAAGLVSGLAAATKYNAVLLVVPPIVSLGFHLAESPEWRTEIFRDRRLVRFGVPFVLAFLVGVPFLFFDRPPFLHAMGELANALQRGDPHAEPPNGWVHILTFSLRYGLGVPVLAAGLTGAVALTRADLRRAAVFLSFPVAYYLVAGSFRLLFVRYALPIVPFLCVTAAFLVCHLTERVADRWQHDPARRSLILHGGTAVAAIAMIWSSAARIWAFDTVLGQADNRVLVSQWVVEHVPTGSSVLQSGGRYGLVQLPPDKRQYQEWRWDNNRHVFLVHDPATVGRRMTAGERPEWLIVQDSPLPSTTQDFVSTILSEGYEQVAVFKAFSPADNLVYDSLDAFYVPLDGLEHVVRPGPNFTIYRRTAPLPSS
jgi:hypothetical protein